MRNAVNLDGMPVMIRFDGALCFRIISTPLNTTIHDKRTALCLALLREQK